ncbi:MAG: radical SAM protein [Hyphomicrobiaceae bacterium]
MRSDPSFVAVPQPITTAAKFTDPDITAKGERRASVPLDRLETLWINTGSLCNITCANCYIESSPHNDRLVYLTRAEVAPLLDEASTLGTREIGFTGGEPFLNPDIIGMLDDALARGFDVLVLTNAMLPMQRRRLTTGLIELKERYGTERLGFRVSLDHHTQALHEKERGPRTWQPTLAGIDWLARNGFAVAIAGRTCWGEMEAEARAGYGRLAADHDWPVDAADPRQLVLFPEMDDTTEVPEITTRCWDILHKSPSDMMCASSRMVVKRKGATQPTVVPCTLIPYASAFDMGPTLAAAAAADGGMFDNGAVKLCHRHCAKFCVLGGGSCS